MSAAQPQNGSCERSDGLWVWGVDPSTRRLAVGFAGSGLAVESVDFRTDLATGHRLSHISDITRTWAALWARKFPPLYCFVEQPAAFGRPPEPALMYAVGVIQAALFDALRYVHAHPVEVRTIAIASWKSRSVGTARAKKDDVMRWALAQGAVGTAVHEGLSQDEADALGIAVAGAKLLEPQPEQMELG